MSNFDHLHPALQHHIVNSLGWRVLRPFQEQVIPPILAGEHTLVLAPTAGGKTEAAFFPVVSRMLTEGWAPLSVLYICPIKALLNNLDIRLSRYCGLLGRQAGLWHGDVKPSQRRRMQKQPPDVLLTTPESLEVMLVSPSVDHRTLLSNVRTVVVDEIHAFAGDDRGWHLLSVLDRVGRIAGRELQRIGLSASVGNPDTLAEWLAGMCAGPRTVIRPASEPPSQAAVTLDFVGSLTNAATVISRLHRGEKRLVFVDSRARAEQLAAELRQLEVTTFVTHSSLSPEQRHQAEEAFAARDDCAIVATSVLELGIDVGDLDRVIQIDAPTTVASFLQRMGRSGRRAGAERNCLILATDDDPLVLGAALVELWSAGYVEPVEPPPSPFHILAQQLLALTLQERGIGRSEWLTWVRRVPAFQAMPAEQIDELVCFMLAQDLLWEEAGILGIGRQGESTYGRQNFLELFSVFTSPPLFSVRHGRAELGFVDESTFLVKQEGPRVLLLAGRPWQVNHIDWQRRLAYVEPSDAPGRTRWKGSGRLLGYRLCQSVREVLATSSQRDTWSRRATLRIDELRREHAWLGGEGTVVVQAGGQPAQWWTHAGTRANAVLANELAALLKRRVHHDGYVVVIDGAVPTEELEQAIASLKKCDVTTMQPSVDEEAVDGLKFAECLPTEMARRMLAARLIDPAGVKATLVMPTRFVVGSGPAT